MTAQWYRADTRETGERWPNHCDWPINIDPADYPDPALCDRCGHPWENHPTDEDCERRKAAIRSNLRKGSRGPERDHKTEARIREIHATLVGYGFVRTNPQIAAALSIERGVRVSTDAVRARPRRW